MKFGPNPINFADYLKLIARLNDKNVKSITTKSDDKINPEFFFQLKSKRMQKIYIATLTM